MEAVKFLLNLVIGIMLGALVAFMIANTEISKLNLELQAANSQISEVKKEAERNVRLVFGHNDSCVVTPN